ncbi:MAG: extracellular protein [Bacteroidetes bacterium HLUCCA01]|nr:MAG: extracellular protein [Bacteroidetes bacterium HLUCCA01]
MKKMILMVVMSAAISATVSAQSLDLMTGTELHIEQNTTPIYIVDALSYAFDVQNGTWFQTQFAQSAHNATNPLIPMPNLTVTENFVNPGFSVQHVVEGGSPNEIFRYLGNDTEYQQVFRNFYNSAGLLDSTQTVILQSDGTEDFADRTLYNYGPDYTVMTMIDGFGQVSRVDSVINVTPDSTIIARFDASGNLMFGITINAQREVSNTRFSGSYTAELAPGQVFNSANPLTAFSRETYTELDLTTGSSVSRTFTRTAQDALNGVAYQTQQYVVTNSTVINGWERESLTYTINMATNDTTLSFAVVNTNESFGLASRRYVNYGEANEYINAESLTFRQAGATQDSTLFAFYNQDGDILSGNASRRTLSSSLPTSITGFTVPAVPTSIDSYSGILPQTISLMQNFPNPFNPSTTIGFDLPQNEQVRLAIYDLLGREVAVLIDQQLPAGVHQVNFDASSLASGQYLYRISTPSATLTRSMTLIK